MPPSARISRPPSKKVSYWTASAEGSTRVKGWLVAELGEEQHQAFFASFINWCSQQVTKFRDPQAKWASKAAREQARTVLEVLRALPLDLRAYVGLMEAYLKKDWGSGYKLGQIKKPWSADGWAIDEGQKSLREVVRTKLEREDILVAEKGESVLTPKARTKRANSAAWANAQKEKEEEEEEKKSSLAQWGPTREAVVGVEEEIEAEDAAAAAAALKAAQAGPRYLDFVVR